MVRLCTKKRGLRDPSGGEGGGGGSSVKVSEQAARGARGRVLAAACGPPVRPRVLGLVVRVCLRVNQLTIRDFSTFSY